MQPTTAKPHHTEQAKANAKMSFPVPSSGRKKTGPSAMKDSGRTRRRTMPTEQPRPPSVKDKTTAARRSGEKPAASIAGFEEKKPKKFRVGKLFKKLFGRNEKGHTEKGERRASAWCPKDQSEMSAF